MIPVCVVKADRWQFLAYPLDQLIPPHFDGFQRLRDCFVRSQTTAMTYRRVAEDINSNTRTRLFLQYQPVLPGLAPFKGTLVPDDHSGLSRQEIWEVVRQFSRYRLLSLEIALDFNRCSGIDLDFVRRHALFGKSHPNTSRLFTRSRTYGSRKGRKRVRCYDKPELKSFRIELELHSAWLRRFHITRLDNLPELPRAIFPGHIRFVRMDWAALEMHLSRRGLDAEGIIRAARDKGDSIHAVLGFLRNRVGVQNVHRFLVTAPPTLFTLLKKWSQSF